MRLDDDDVCANFEALLNRCIAVAASCLVLVAVRPRRGYKTVARSAYRFGVLHSVMARSAYLRVIQVRMTEKMLARDMHMVV
jgi:hypothetical protein